MPRKSVTILANEIELLRRSIKDYYLEVYNDLKKDYYNIFRFCALDKAYKEGQTTKPLTPEQSDELKRLQKKQAKSFQDPNAPRLTKE